MTEFQSPQSPHNPQTPHNPSDPSDRSAPAPAPGARSLRRARAKGMLAGAVGVAAIGAASVVGINAATAADTPTPTPSATASPSPEGTPDSSDGKGPGGRGGHGPGGFGFGAFGGDAADLADKLGVTEDELTAAMSAVRDDLRDATDAPADGERPDRAAMQEKLAAALATELDLDTADVTAALEELRTEAEADRTAAFEDRLDQAVTDGTLTRSEADAVLKAAEAGVIGMGGPGGHGPR